MAALRGCDAEIAKSSFHDDASSRYLIPLDGNAQPRIVRSPATHANQEVRQSTLGEFRIHLGNDSGDLMAAGALESVEVDDHSISQILYAPVPQNFGTLTQES